MTDWINVKDKMPKCGELVLIYIANLNDSKGAYALDKCHKVDGKKEWEFYNKCNADFDVTHWVLLPQKPESESNAEWVDNKCSNCGKGIENLIDSREWYENEKPNYCPFCGTRFKESE